MTNYPTSNGRVTKIIRYISGIDFTDARSHPKTASSAQPARFTLPDQRSTFDVASSAVDDVARKELMAGQPVCVSGCYAGDTLNDYPILADVLRHDGWYSDRYVVKGVELTTERSRLYAATCPSAYVA
jgi:hypothetical protein